MCSTRRKEKNTFVNYIVKMQQTLIYILFVVMMGILFYLC